MKELLKIGGVDFQPCFYPGENTSGLQVFGRNVLVRMDECAGYTGGGILLTDDMRDNLSMGAETGCIYSLGPEAFRRFDDGSKWIGEHPEVGDRIYVAKYSGLVAKGKDGHIYRAMDYSCIVAGLEKKELAA